MIKPILFNTEMVKAILDGRKTVTRRVVKWFVPDDAQFGYTAFTPKGCISARGIYEDGYGEKFYKLPYQPGDILWVREAWALVNESVGMGYKTKKIIYRANYSDIEAKGWKWRPSIHMPREAARIFLRVTVVRVERLRNMNAADAYKEGVSYNGEATQREVIERFSTLWDSTIKPADREKYGRKANPWVWRIEFEKCNRPDGF